MFKTKLVSKKGQTVTYEVRELPGYRLCGIRGFLSLYAPNGEEVVWALKSLTDFESRDMAWLEAKMSDHRNYREVVEPAMKTLGKRLDAAVAAALAAFADLPAAQQEAIRQALGTAIKKEI